jgi:hypothetical protein
MSNNLDEKYFRILQKCSSHLETADFLLETKTLRGVIVEELDSKDIATVTKTISKTSDSLGKLRAYTDQLNLKTELQSMYDYIEALEDALERSSKELTSVSFDTGKLSSFFGKKLSLPEITSAAVKLNTRAVDFGRGFLKSMTKIRSELLPLLKNADKNSTLVDAIAADPEIDLDKISKGVEDILTKSLSGTMFKKVSSFFSKARIGKEADIMSGPGLSIDMKELAADVAENLFNAKISNLLGEAPPEAPPESLVTDLADEMQDTADEAAADGDTTNDPEGEADTEEVDQNLQNAVKDSKDEISSPLDSAHDAIDTWVASLSNSSQKTIKGSGRLSGLKDAIRSKLETSAKTIEADVRTALEDWRSEHEETLVRSKKFSKKNFDSLSNLIPKLTSFMLSQTSESTIFERRNTRRFVFSYLNKHYQQRIDESVSTRLQKLAGLINE